MAMSPNPISAGSEFSRGRAQRPNKPSLGALVRNQIGKARWRLGKLVSISYVRVLMIVVVSFAAGVAWGSYGDPARKAVASWSPHLSWLAPTPSSERIRAMSLALAAARQNLNKVANEMSRLEAQSVDAPRR
jgi:hypothetical protein